MQYFKAAVIGIIAVALASVAMLFVIEEADAKWEATETPNVGPDLHVRSSDGGDIDIGFICLKDGRNFAYIYMHNRMLSNGFGINSPINVLTNKGNYLFDKGWGVKSDDIIASEELSEIELQVAIDYIAYPQPTDESARSFIIKIEHHNGYTEDVSFVRDGLGSAEIKFTSMCNMHRREQSTSQNNGLVGDTPLHAAIRNGDISTARAIISSSEIRKLCATNHLGQTPWSLAQILDVLDVQLMLISAKATWQCNE